MITAKNRKKMLPDSTFVTVTPVRKVSAVETLLRIPVGKSTLLSTRTFREGVLRTAITRLNKTGYHYSITVAGQIDKSLITRYK